MSEYFLQLRVVYPLFKKGCYKWWMDESNDSWTVIEPSDHASPFTAVNRITRAQFPPRLPPLSNVSNLWNSLDTFFVLKAKRQAFPENICTPNMYWEFNNCYSPTLSPRILICYCMFCNGFLKKPSPTPTTRGLQANFCTSLAKKTGSANELLRLTAVRPHTQSIPKLPASTRELLSIQVKCLGSSWWDLHFWW